MGAELLNNVRILIIAFVAGICCLNLFHTLPNWYWYLFLLPLIFIRIITRQKVIEYIIVLILGLCWAQIYVQHLLVWELPKELEEKSLKVTGYVASIPNVTTHFTTFEFLSNGTKFKLAWYGNPQKLSPGEFWQLQVVLKRPHGNLNPGGFDYEKYLFQHHIRATGYVQSGNLLTLPGKHFFLTRLRQKIIISIQQHLFHDNLAPLISTLVTGDENTITPQQWQVLRNTGTSYLMAISGLHIGLVATVMCIFMHFCWCRFPKLVLMLPAKYVGVVAGLVVAIIYSLVSGLSIPTQRALIMLSVFLFGIIFRRHLRAGDGFCYALFLVVLIDPIAVLSIGFWLSFLAVAGIILVTVGRLKSELSWWQKYWRMQLAVTLAILPLTLLFFQQLSLVALLANLVAMPVVCLVVVPLSLIGVGLMVVTKFFGAWILYLALQLMKLVWLWLELLARISWLNWYHAIYNKWILLTSMAGVFLLLMPRKFPAKYLGVAWLLPLFFYTPSGPNPGELWFSVLDVGQGLASVVRTAKHVLIYDAGPKTLTTDAGSAVVVPFLRMSGVHDVDLMVISHGDNDHIGGAESIFWDLKVAKILTSVPNNFPGRDVRKCDATQSWQWDGISFTMLAPVKNSAFVGNNASCVLQVGFGKSMLLLTGDIERDAEQVLLQNYSSALATTILQAPHHGSATSSSNNFVAAVQPRFVIFPVGYKNRFHFPANSVLKRYQEIGAKLLSTADLGAITFKIISRSNIITPNFYREVIKKYWNDNAEDRRQMTEDRR